MKNKHFIHNGSVISDINPDTCEVLSEYFVKDDRRIYFAGSGEILTEDIDNFKLLGGLFYQLGDKVYCKTTELKNIDVNSFEILSPETHLAKDCNGLYQAHHDKVMVKDPPSFQLLSSSVGTDKLAIYGQTPYHAPFYIYGPDWEKLSLKRNKFVYLGHNYIRDDLNVYYGNIPLPDVDPTTVEILDENILRDKYAYHLVYGHGTESKPLKNEYLGGNYFKNSRVVYHKDYRIKGAKPKSFKWLGYENLACDKNHVYFDALVVEKADPETFRVVAWFEKAGYAVDNHYVYMRESKYDGYDEYHDVLSPIVIGDVSSFEVIDELLTMDKNYIYIGGFVCPSIDRSSFEKVGSYCRDHRSVYFKGDRILKAIPDSLEDLGHGFATVEFRDSGTFRVLEHGFATDDESIFYCGDRLYPPRCESFIPYTDGYCRNGDQILWIDIKDCRWENDSGAEVRPWVFEESKNINGELPDISEELTTNINAATFRILSSGYATDGNLVVYNGEIVKGACAKSFSVLNQYYGKDNKHIYCGSKQISADPKTFVILSAIYEVPDTSDSFTNNSFCIFGAYGYDKKCLYQLHKEGADLNNFRRLDEYFGINNGVVIYFPTFLHYDYDYSCTIECIEDADAETFEALGDGYGRDKDSYFYGTKLLYYEDENEEYPLEDCDPESFIVLTDGYAKSDSRVYYEGYSFQCYKEDRKWPHVAEFITLGGNYAKDDKYIYHEGGNCHYVDTASFKYTTERIAYDKDHLVEQYGPKFIYHKDTRERMKISDIEYLQDGHFRYKQNIYYIHQDGRYILISGDANSFELLGDNYSKDSKYIYYKHGVIRRS